MLKFKCKAGAINDIVLCTSTRASVKSMSMRSQSWTFEKQTALTLSLRTLSSRPGPGLLKTTNT